MINRALETLVICAANLIMNLSPTQQRKNEERAANLSLVGRLVYLSNCLKKSERSLASLEVQANQCQIDAVVDAAKAHALFALHTQQLNSSTPAWALEKTQALAEEAADKRMKSEVAYAEAQASYEEARRLLSEGQQMFANHKNQAIALLAPGYELPQGV